MKSVIKDFSSKCDQIRSFLRIWSYLLKKSLMENFVFCVVFLIRSKLTIKTPEWHCWRRPVVFIVIFRQILHIRLMLPLLTLNKQMSACHWSQVTTWDGASFFLSSIYATHVWMSANEQNFFKHFFTFLNESDLL